jgi:hypothetical protein
VLGRHVEKRFDSVSRRRDLGITWHGGKKRPRPVGERSVLAETTVEIDAGEEDIAAEVAELNTDAPAQS